VRPQRAPSTTRSPGRVLAFAVASLVGGLLLFAAVAALISTGRTESRLGSNLLTVGNAARLEPEVEERGPLVFQALVGDRDLFVHHVAGEWLAFETTAPGAPRRCQLEWRPRQFVFRDPCDRRTYPAGGAGLVHYRAFVDAEGVLKIDLRDRRPPPAPTPAPSSTSSTTTVGPPNPPASGTVTSSR
jgi:hypothetical protein